MTGAELAAWYFVLAPNLLILLIFAASGWLARFDDEPRKRIIHSRPTEMVPPEQARAKATVLNLDEYRSRSRQRHPMHR
jgi:hypothetical protein